MVTHAQKKAPSVKFDTYEWDFGTVDAAKGAVCHTFTLKNVSGGDFKIAKDIPSCECIKAVYPDKTVKKGDLGTVAHAVGRGIEAHGVERTVLPAIRPQHGKLGGGEPYAVVSIEEPAPLRVTDAKMQR